MSRDDGRKPVRRGKAAAVTEKPARLPSEISQAAQAATRKAAPRRSEGSAKERIVARLKRLHPMD